MRFSWRHAQHRLLSLARLGIVSSVSGAVSSSKVVRSEGEAISAPIVPRQLLIQADSLRVRALSFKSMTRLIQEWMRRLFRVSYSLWRLLYISAQLSPPLLLSPFLLLGNNDFARTWSQLLKSCIERCGPCSIKFAQWVATRPDLFPLYVCETLEGLQAESRTQSSHHIVESLRAAFGDTYSESILLDSERPQVLGCGCVAEVVLASYNGKPVAVKVIHPDVKRDILTDIDLLRLCSGFIELFPGMHNLSLVEMVDEFAELMLRQLDMRSEAAALDRFRNNFKERSWSRVSFPLVLFSSESILIESFEEGELLSKALKANMTPAACKDIADVGLNAFLKMVFIDNFVHGDLHPGNIIIRRHKRNFELIFIDVGITVELKPADRRNFIDLFTAIVKRDARAVGRLMVERSRGKKCNDPVAFEKDLAAIVDDVHANGLSLGRIKVGELLQRVLVLCYIHGVKLESRFANLILAIGVLEGLGRRLDPDLDLISRAAPFILKSTVT